MLTPPGAESTQTCLRFRDNGLGFMGCGVGNMDLPSVSYKKDDLAIKGSMTSLFRKVPVWSSFFSWRHMVVSVNRGTPI